MARLVCSTWSRLAWSGRLAGMLSTVDKGARWEEAWPAPLYSRGGYPPVPASSQDRS
jgi:hypothetical protein